MVESSENARISKLKGGKSHSLSLLEKKCSKQSKRKGKGFVGLCVRLEQSDIREMTLGPNQLASVRRL